MEALLNDDGERQKFMSDPRGYLKQAGVAVPDGVDVNVVEDTPSVKNIVLPLKGKHGADGELSDADLGAVSGAGGGSGSITIAGSDFCISFGGWF
jgi:hypothetical protein